MVRRCAAFGRRNLLLDVCFFDSARMRASGRRNLLLELVQRFYEATSWRVLLSGKDVRKHNLLALRYVVAGVPQEPFLFAASIRENIAYRHDRRDSGSVTSVTSF
jgi:ATP-binding cassette subfamily B (MDR/TAP) protein 1